MSDEFNLSRRKTLTALGGIGVASAGAGLGTSAFFSDAETFEGNSLTAGQLQLYGSWQQIYYGASQETRPQDYGPAGRPWVNAYPDDTDNGIQSLGDRRYVADPDDDPKEGANIPLSCRDFENLPDPPRPVIDLDDVKPGDKGEVTFGITLCDNPAYLWLQSANIEMENVPEEETQLGEFIKAKVWYDEDCDNVPDECTSADLMLTIDFSGSMFYDRYGGVVSDDPIDITGDGEDDYGETTKIDQVERAVYELIVHLRDDLDCEYNVGAVFTNGYDGDDLAGTGTGEPKLKVVEPTEDLDSLIADGDYNRDNVPSDVGDDPNEGGDLRNLRSQLAELVAHEPDPVDDPDEYVWDPFTFVDQSDISTGTALAAGLEESASVMDDGETFGERHTIAITDGEPWKDGQLTADEFEEVFQNASDIRTGELNGVESTICVIGDSLESDAGVYAQRVIANSAGIEIDVDGARDAVAAILGGAPLADFDPADVGGNLAYWFDLHDPGVATEVYAICLSTLLEEYVIAHGSLASVLADLNEDGIQLFRHPHGDIGACFEPDGTHCFGFKWWFPTGQENVNDAQADSVTFDLRFFAEQCRHNTDPTGPPSPAD